MKTWGRCRKYLTNMLYKKTKLEDTFSVNMLAVADGRPETMGIVPMIRHHVNFQLRLQQENIKTLLEKELEKRSAGGLNQSL